MNDEELLSGFAAGTLKAQHPELARRDLLDDYDSTGRLTTDDARTTFVEPDLKAL